MPHLERRIATAVTAAVMLGVSNAAVARAAGSTTELDPQAGALVKKMSDYMGGLKSFTADAYVVDEQIMGDGFKLSVLKAGSIKVQRPNKFFIKHRSMLGDQEAFFDGSRLVVHGKDIGMFIETLWQQHMSTQEHGSSPEFCQHLALHLHMLDVFGVLWWLDRWDLFVELDFDDRVPVRI